MRLVKTYNFHRRDFTGNFQCEHCDFITYSVSCYDDTNFHQNVIPAMVCPVCKLASPAGVPITQPRQRDDEVM